MFELLFFEVYQMFLQLSLCTVTPENYKLLLEMLMEVKTEWYSLGTVLDIETDVLDSIKYASRVKYTVYLKELLSLWMKKGKEEATWEKLREALINCYQKKLAAALEGKSGPGIVELFIPVAYHPRSVQLRIVQS